MNTANRTNLPDELLAKACLVVDTFNGDEKACACLHRLARKQTAQLRMPPKLWAKYIEAMTQAGLDRSNDQDLLAIEFVAGQRVRSHQVARLEVARSLGRGGIWGNRGKGKAPKPE